MPRLDRPIADDRCVRNGRWLNAASLLAWNTLLSFWGAA